MTSPRVARIASAGMAPPITTACQVEAVTSYAALVALGPAWTSLAHQAALPHPFLSHEWVCAWWEAFGAGRELRVLLATAEGRIVGIAPLMLSRARMYGLELRCLQSIHNEHTPRADFLVASGHPEAYEAIWAYLRRTTASWDVLLLAQLSAGAETLEQLPRLAARDGFRAGLWRSNGSPYLSLRESWDGYFARLDARHRRNLRNRLKRLNRLGEVALRSVSSLENGVGALEDGLRIEAAAWKGRAGTAISSRPELRRFYTRLAQKSAERGWLRLQFLTVAGRPIAFGYFLRYERNIYLLKPGYDPAFAVYSPCNLLCYMVLREAFGSDVAEYDFLGDDDLWKRQWTGEVRLHYWLFVFPDRLRPRLLHFAKFRALPWLKHRGLYRRARRAVGPRRPVTDAAGEVSAA